MFKKDIMFDSYWQFFVLQFILLTRDKSKCHIVQFRSKIDLINEVKCSIFCNVYNIAELLLLTVLGMLKYKFQERWSIEQIRQSEWVDSRVYKTITVLVLVIDFYWSVEISIISMLYCPCWLSRWLCRRLNGPEPWVSPPPLPSTNDPLHAMTVLPYLEDLHNPELSDEEAGSLNDELIVKNSGMFLIVCL